MIDWINALRGKQHCGWCNDKPPTRWDRLMRFDQLIRTDSRPWYERIAISWSDFNIETLRIWRFGSRHHYKHHIDFEED